MKKLLLLLFIPLLSFSQITLEDIVSISGEQSFKRTMIEKGFDKNEEESEDDLFRYDKSAMDKLMASAMFRSLDSLSSDAVVVFMFPEDFIGRNDNYDSIYDLVKSDCEFAEVKEYAGNEVAFYNCPNANVSTELMELEKLYLKTFDKPLTRLPIQIGFVRTGSLFVIYYPITDASIYIAMIKGIIGVVEDVRAKDSIQK